MRPFKAYMASGRGTATPVVAVTWNPLDKSADVVLSNGDLTAGRTGSFGHQAARGTMGRSSGKYYYECLIAGPDASGLVVGVGRSTAGLNTLVGGDANGWGFAYNSSTYTSGNQTTVGVAMATGDVIGIAVDLTVGGVWFAKNNAWISGDPAAGTTSAYTGLSGSIFPMCSLEQATGGRTWTARFKSSDFTYSPPSGFSPWES